MNIYLTGGFKEYCVNRIADFTGAGVENVNVAFDAGDEIDIIVRIDRNFSTINSWETEELHFDSLTAFETYLKEGS